MEVRDLSIDAADRDAAREALAAIAARDAAALVAAANGGTAQAGTFAAATPPQSSPSAPVAAVPATPDPVATYHEVSIFAPLRLLYPFEIDGVEVFTVSLLPPTFGDVEAVMTGQMLELELHARMCGLSVAAMRAMRWPDAELVTGMARLVAPAMGRS